MDTFNRVSTGSRILLAATLWVIILVWVAGCSDDDKGTNPDPGPTVTYDLYVDVATGADANDGSAGNPVKTITHAMTQAVAGDSIKVAPGLYNAASGEVFPIQLPDSVTLIGDVANRGVGTDTVRVEGGGDYDGSNWATIAGGHNSILTGFYIVQPGASLLRFCIVSEDDDFTAVGNTFQSGYGCFRLLGTGNPLIQGNTLSSSYYGVYSACTGSAVIRDNDFINGSYIDIQLGSAEIIHNTFTGNPGRAISTQGGSSVIDSNSLTGSYSLGALRFHYSSTPTVRRTSVTANGGPCVQILGNSNPDLGTAADPGGNTFGGTSGQCVYMESPATVDAYGNTWLHMPPTCGADIVVVGAGMVVTGAGISDTCSQ